MGFGLRSTTAAFVYMPHSAVVIRFETALPLRTREKGGRRILSFTKRNALVTTSPDHSHSPSTTPAARLMRCCTPPWTGKP